MSPEIDKHLELCRDLHSLYVRKNHDYGDSFHRSFVEEGMAMPRIRLGDKFYRFQTLSRLSEQDGQKVLDESIRDTLMDLANYALMTILEIDKKDGDTDDGACATYEKEGGILLCEKTG